MSTGGFSGESGMESENVVGGSSGDNAQKDAAISTESLGDAFEGRGGIVTGRGTADGLNIRLDARVDKTQLRAALMDFIAERKSFLAGNSVSFEWVGGRADPIFVAEITQQLETEFKVKVSDLVTRGTGAANAESIKAGRAADRQAGLDMKRGVVALESREARTDNRYGDKAEDRPVSLFDGIEVLGLDEGRGSDIGAGSERCAEKKSQGGGRSDSTNAALWDDPDARILHTTLRSGQKIETEHSLVIFGDVNSGAEVVAGGDIIVLGVLRGVAHAGAFDETGAGRVILALNLQPTQLRIGSVISRGSAGGAPVQAVAEVARVEGNLIVVEPYQARANVKTGASAKSAASKLAQMKKLVVGE